MSSDVQQHAVLQVPGEDRDKVRIDACTPNGECMTYEPQRDAGEPQS